MQKGCGGWINSFLKNSNQLWESVLQFSGWKSNNNKNQTTSQILKKNASQIMQMRGNSSIEFRMA